MMVEYMRSTYRAAVKKWRFETLQKLRFFLSASPEVKLTCHFRRSLGAILGLTVLFFALADGNAQSGGATGTIVGTVVDSSGAMVVGAKVTMTEAATNVAREAATS